MAELRPVMFRWVEADVCVEGGEVRRMTVMVPHSRFGALCKRQFAIDEDYALGPADDVPSRSRAPLFIGCKEAWGNLPAENKDFPHWEHLRKAALVKGAGWATHSQSIWDTPADAKKHAIELRKKDEFAIITVSGRTVDVWVAKSVSAGTPGLTKQKYREVQTMALDWVATLARTTRAELEAAAGRSA